VSASRPQIIIIRKRGGTLPLKPTKSIFSLDGQIFEIVNCFLGLPGEGPHLGIIFPVLSSYLILPLLDLLLERGILLKDGLIATFPVLLLVLGSLQPNLVSFVGF
jgi:hypothetical protein